MRLGRREEEVFDLRDERGPESRLFGVQFLQQRLLQHMQVMQLPNSKFTNDVWITCRLDLAFVRDFDIAFSDTILPPVPT